MPRFRFQVGGFIEVTADTAQEAQELVTSNTHDAPRAFTEVRGPVFVYTVAVGRPEEEKD